MAWVYYNEFDKNAAAWLRELIKENLIAPGEVDERSIEDVLPSELAGFTQCHFFAGIGGWSYALRLAGWPDYRPVWTGSCPCQPFSSAGKGEGFADERHLWPAWHHLIGQRKPPVIFGEQVESAIRHGWLDLVQDDLEGLGYAVGTIGLPAPSVGAAHIRQRIWFVADTNVIKIDPAIAGQCGSSQRVSTGFMADTESERFGETRSGGERPAQRTGVKSGTNGLAKSPCEGGCGRESIRTGGYPESGRSGKTSHMADARSSKRDQRIATPQHPESPATLCGGILLLPCTDGKYRPVEPAPVGLADGVSDSLGLMRDADTGAAFFHPLVEKGKTTQRVMRLKGYGNAIHPEVAAEFIRAYMETGK